MYDNFTGESMNYNLERYNFPAWALNRIQEKFPQVTNLETIHETVPLKDIGALHSWVSAGCETLEFMEMLDHFLVENISPKVSCDFYVQFVACCIIACS